VGANVPTEMEIARGKRGSTRTACVKKEKTTTTKGKKVQERMTWKKGVLTQGVCDGTDGKGWIRSKEKHVSGKKGRSETARLRRRS